ncbi:MAG: hypothetical protein JW993_17800 [Sedimentisphaerales bacterium]|nr:hypothetical protein [Sedimentisphaerales bacterium]
MMVEAPLSRYTRNSFIIYVAACLIGAAWFAYDGYFNQTFISKHTDEQGRADFDLAFNRAAPPFLLAGAVLLAGYFLAIRNRKLVADDDALAAGKETIPYDAIEKIDKTFFEKKGYFIITYTRNGVETRRKLTDRQFDNLPAILDLLVAKITQDQT